MPPSNKFFRISSAVGRLPLFVQGAGGNISEKQKGEMYIKASGHFLKNLEKNQGYVCLNHLPLRAYLKNFPSSIEGRLSQHENNFNNLINQNVLAKKSFGVPSIETGMHAGLARYTVHTHSVYANVLNCMRGGRKQIKEILKNFSPEFIEYRNPGFHLAHAVEKAQKNRKKISSVIFLQNHGLITHHNNPETALALTFKVNDALEKYFKENKAFRPFKVKKAGADFSRHLFPDSVVYSQIDFSSLPQDKKQVFYEISSATNYILDTIRLLGAKPIFIREKNINFIKNMEKEKMRIKMMKNK